jgi:type IV fimbrial biogenesis protein FimT
MLSRRRIGGFSLIELMIGLALLAVLLALGVPEFYSYLRNAKVRSAAENLYAGMQLARAEAVRRNAWIQLVLTTDEPIDANVASLTAAASAPNWAIRRIECGGVYTFVEGKSMTEGAGSNAPPAVITGQDPNGNGVTTVTFNGFGQSIIVNADCTTSQAPKATLQVTGYYFGGSDPRYGDRCTGVRCLNIQVASGGQSRMCDPSVTDTHDSRSC